MSDIYAGAMERLAAKRAAVPHRAVDDIVPTVTYVAFGRHRQLAEFVTDGQIDEGFEASGTVLSLDAIEAMNLAQRERTPCQYLAIGERRYSDGRHFLDLAINPRWLEETTNYRRRNDRWVWVCPDCDGINDDHRQIDLPDPDGGKGMRVKCPRDMSAAKRGWR